MGKNFTVTGDQSPTRTEECPCKLKAQLNPPLGTPNHEPVALLLVRFLVAAFAAPV